VELRRHQITQLERGTFGGVSNLKALRLDFNKLRPLDAVASFKALLSLTEFAHRILAWQWPGGLNVHMC